MLFGAHVSVAGGVQNAPINASAIGCEVFQIFTRSPQGGNVPELTDQNIKEFLKNCKKYKQKEWYVHTPFFINFSSANPRIKYASISVVREELERASLLKAKYLMTHLGSYKDLGKEKGLLQVVDSLDKMLTGYKGQTEFLIEISAGSGEIIGDTFEEIAEIIHHPKLKKYKIGVCFDTQHAFASGYDLRNELTVKKTFTEFDKVIGLENLKMSHCNDSLTEMGSHKDRHAHIGQGLIGKSGFEAIVNNKKLKDINFILETEHDLIVEDLKLLKKIRG